MTFADRIATQVARALDAQGVTQAAAGEVLDMSQTAVWRRINGQTSWRIDELEALAAALNCELRVELAPVDPVRA